jgi:hypothetical protein
MCEKSSPIKAQSPGLFFALFRKILHFISAYDTIKEKKEILPWDAGK